MCIQIDDFFANFEDVALKVMDLLVEQSMKILGLVFKFLGPVGDFFEQLLSAVCPMLNTVMGVIDTALKVVTGGSGSGWKAMTCPKNSLGASRGSRPRFVLSF